MNLVPLTLVSSVSQLTLVTRVVSGGLQCARGAKTEHGKNKRMLRSVSPDVKHEVNLHKYPCCL